MQIYRHDSTSIIGTDLDPIEDILNLIVTLKSKGYTEDLLRQIHGFTSSSEINKTAKLIGLHVTNAMGLSEQAFSGSPETSYLPLYYSTLNLAKVNLLLLGKRLELENNRWHGASYNENDMKKTFLNERVEIKNRGTIPLIYSTLSGKTIPKKGIKITLDDIYSNILNVGAEYKTVMKKPNKMMAHRATIIRDDNQGHYLEILVRGDYFIANPPKPRTIKAYPKISLASGKDGRIRYVSKKIKGDFNILSSQLKSKIDRCLLSDNYYLNFDEWISFTPINGKKYVFNEEISIMLAFFHLSNVVRYNPEHLYKLIDSRYWAIMLALRKHGFLKFIKLMWGNYNKLSFDIT